MIDLILVLLMMPYRWECALCRLELNALNIYFDHASENEYNLPDIFYYISRFMATDSPPPPHVIYSSVVHPERLSHITPPPPHVIYSSVVHPERLSHITAA